MHGDSQSSEHPIAAPPVPARLTPQTAEAASPAKSLGARSVNSIHDVETDVLLEPAEDVDGDGELDLDDDNPFASVSLAEPVDEATVRAVLEQEELEALEQ